MVPSSVALGRPCMTEACRRTFLGGQANGKAKAMERGGSGQHLGR